MWHPFPDELPPNGGMYLWTVYDDLWGNCFVTFGHWFPEKQKVVLDKGKGKNVKAWMLAPKPYPHKKPKELAAKAGDI